MPPKLSPSAAEPAREAYCPEAYDCCAPAEGGQPPYGRVILNRELARVRVRDVGKEMQGGRGC